jgi:tetratricopeptide (TPR) repeat protein
MARESKHPLTIAYTLGHANMLWVLLADLPRAKAAADENLAYSDANGIKTWQIYALGWQAMANALAGRHLEALDAARQVLLRSGAAGQGLFVPFVLSGEIRSLLALGRHADCAARIGEAKERMADSGECWIEADILRLEGDLHLAKGDMAAAENSYGRAIEVAVQQEAKLLELRAATSLARLWADQGERQRALDVLAPVHGWFSQGFDAADVATARLLLDELA